MDLAARTEEFLGGFAHRWCLQFPVYYTYRGCYFNCLSPFSIPKRKNTFVEPTRGFFRLQISPALVGCSLFSFRTVNRGKQLKITLYMSYGLNLFWLFPQQWDGRGLSQLGAGGSARDLGAGLTKNVIQVSSWKIREAILSKKCSFFNIVQKAFDPPPLLFEHLSYFAGGVF